MSNNKQVSYRKSLLSVLVIILLIILFVVLFKISRKIAIPENDADIIGNFIEWFGILYGVLLALVVVEVWHRYSLINSEVDQEADALVLLLKTVRYINDKVKLNRLATKALEYSKIMLQAEGSHNFAQTAVNEKLDELHNEVGNILKENKISLPLSLEIIRYINDAIDQRGDWLSHVRERMPKGLWTLVITSSLFWVLGYFGLNIENETIALIICGVATFTVSAILFIIVDLDEPIGGIWRVRFESFEVLQNEAEKILNKK